MNPLLPLASLRFILFALFVSYPVERAILGKLRVIHCLLCAITLPSALLLACSERPEHQFHAGDVQWRAETFYGPRLREYIERGREEVLFNTEQRFLLHYRAGSLASVLERLKLYDYAVEKTNATFLQITLRLNSEEKLHQLQQIDAITAVSLAPTQPPISK